MQKIILWSSLALNLCALLAVVVLSARFSLWDKFIYYGRSLPRQPVWQEEVRKHQAYAQLHRQPVRIVMVGNSLVHGGEWAELLQRSDVVNRGISGDVTRGILDRLEPVLALKPRYVCIMAGINDLSARRSVADVFAIYRQIIETCRAEGINPILMSTLYTRMPDYLNQEVAALNQALQRYAQQENIAYLDLNPILAPEGRLQLAYTYDGVHLTAEGYLRWAEALRTLLQTLAPL
ncbi:Lysophospholipase L1 [Catalinimonas alkaloidigena]|uniref:Lysophospholipase L1 n=1 Tax=Catalinimonas alkaloidigena TaxID=1075417 RepID=A0A1G9LFS2_9BACT|nr:GDSL-type esterase/lipase family protein [Catalinimonas alkaloidigena]SDL60375.1 Lysophospholipase L1 [Catalinimonas alkaloidigena]